MINDKELYHFTQYILPKYQNILKEQKQNEEKAKITLQVITKLKQNKLRKL